MEGKMLNSLAILLLAMGLLACGEGKKDELGPYVQTIQGFETHTKKLSTYRNYLTTPGMESKADAVKETYQVLIDELKKIELEDKKNQVCPQCASAWIDGVVAQNRGT
jgi:hypothetical protein